MKHRKHLPVAALRAFEAAARLGRMVAAADELALTHGAISRHVTQLEAMLGTPLFEGPRNRPVLTPEGRVLGFALTHAFDQMEDAIRLVAKGNDSILDVACLSTFAMRWLIPRLHDFVGRFPDVDVRLATDERPIRNKVDVQILVVQPELALPEGATLLFKEWLGLVAVPDIASRIAADGLHGARVVRMETRTRPTAWAEWEQLAGMASEQEQTGSSIFDHYHLTIEAALNGLGAAIVPWHLVAGEVACQRLVAPYGFRDSRYRYIATVERPRRRKSEHFVDWLKEAVEAFPRPPSALPQDVDPPS